MTTRSVTQRESPEEPDAADAATSSARRIRKRPPTRLSSIWTSAIASRSTVVVVAAAVVDVFAWVAVVAQFHRSYDDRNGAADAVVVVEHDEVDDDD